MNTSALGRNPHMVKGLCGSDFADTNDQVDFAAASAVTAPPRDDVLRPLPGGHSALPESRSSRRTNELKMRQHLRIALGLFAVAGAPLGAQTPRYDLIITGGTVIDGTGAP